MIYLYIIFNIRGGISDSGEIQLHASHLLLTTHLTLPDTHIMAGATLFVSHLQTRSCVQTPDLFQRTCRTDG